MASDTIFKKNRALSLLMASWLNRKHYIVFILLFDLAPRRRGYSKGTIPVLSVGISLKAVSPSQTCGSRAPHAPGTSAQLGSSSRWAASGCISSGTEALRKTPCTSAKRRHRVGTAGPHRASEHRGFGSGCALKAWGIAGAVEQRLFYCSSCV